MIRSMTAYGRGEHTSKDTRFIVEIKSVNNRYRDIIVRSPKSLQGFEEEIRSQVASRTKRGRIEVFIQLEKGGEEVEYDLELNMPLVKTYLRIFKQLGETFGLDENIKKAFKFLFSQLIEDKNAHWLRMAFDIIKRCVSGVAIAFMSVSNTSTSLLA